LSFGGGGLGYFFGYAFGVGGEGLGRMPTKIWRRINQFLV
jgi:hypothetical protein